MWGSSRLKPGAPFVAAHCSFPQNPEDRDTWLARHREFVVASGVDPTHADNACRDISDKLEAFDPEVDEKIFRDAGFWDVTLFYSASTWRGWFGRAR